MALGAPDPHEMAADGAHRWMFVVECGSEDLLPLPLREKPGNVAACAVTRAWTGEVCSGHEDARSRWYEACLSR